MNFGTWKQRTGEQVKASRQAALRRGRWAEHKACVALMMRGYRIAGRNFRHASGEIDIVARKGDLIAFVEVKARIDLASAMDAVGSQSRRRIANAAQMWLSRQKDADRLSWRFDIVAVIPWRWPVHVEDAFQAPAW